MAKKIKRKPFKHLALLISIFVFCLFLAGVFFFWHKIKKEYIPPIEPQTQSTTTPTEIVRGDTTKKQIIFTFDGGAGADSGDQILGILAKHHVKGTFFLTGKFVENNPDFVKRMSALGNEIFSHTYDHKDLTTLSNDGIAKELTKMADVLKATTGLSPKPYFRAPYGSRSPRVLKIAAENGYQSVYWTKDALDWEEPTGETADQVKEKILTSLAPGNIYLMHVGDNITGAILDNVFTAIEAKGYKIVSLTQGL